jgi:hypothetical protein
MCKAFVVLLRSLGQGVDSYPEDIHEKYRIPGDGFFEMFTEKNIILREKVELERLEIAGASDNYFYRIKEKALEVFENEKALKLCA